ncbi:MAG: hypothetical protein DMF76_21555 [Acidobacteria bacterium]|nr:MAG: hypothetical protein DMF76_21555 [Acidobacteriota bacterium]
MPTKVIVVLDRRSTTTSAVNFWKPTPSTTLLAWGRA